MDITTAGRFNANVQGVTTITASYQGRTASKSVSVVNNYGGTWAGTYILRACDQAGAFRTANWCQGLGGVGATLPFSLALNQAVSNDRTQLTGTLALGALAGNVSGNVTADGRMVLGGSYGVSSSGITFTIQVGGWDTRLSGASGMSGRWALNLTASGTSGNAYEEVEIVSTSHTAIQSVPVSSAPSSYALTLGEVIERMR
jgi:hypothetical protein